MASTKKKTAPKAKGQKAKKTTIKKAQTAPKAKGAFHVAISTSGQEHEAHVDSIAEYLTSLDLGLINTKTVIRVTYGDKTVEKLLMCGKARLLFTQKLHAEVFEKNIKIALNAH